jgi:sorbitol/mannitol transport system permease protein
VTITTEATERRTERRPEPPDRGTERHRRDRKDRWVRRAPLLPALVFAIVITQLPFLLTIWYSLHSWNLLRDPAPTFVGFQNFALAWTSEPFRQAILVTVVFTTSAVVLAVVVGMLLALLVHRRFLGRGIVRTLLITPFLVMPAAAALIWKTSFLNPTFGLFNWFLGLFGVDGPDWLSEFAGPSIILILVWQWSPFMMLILLAGLQSQPEDALEAAQIDGAGSFQIFRFLTLPHLRRYIELGTVLGAIFILQTYDTIFMTTNGGPGRATTNLPFFLYLQAFRGFEIGQAAALGIVVVIFTIALATIALRLFAKVFKEAR